MCEPQAFQFAEFWGPRMATAGCGEVCTEKVRTDCRRAQGQRAGALPKRSCLDEKSGIFRPQHCRHGKFWGSESSESRLTFHWSFLRCVFSTAQRQLQGLDSCRCGGPREGPQKAHGVEGVGEGVGVQEAAKRRDAAQREGMDGQGPTRFQKSNKKTIFLLKISEIKLI